MVLSGIWILVVLAVSSVVITGGLVLASLWQPGLMNLHKVGEIYPLDSINEFSSDAMRVGSEVVVGYIWQWDNAKIAKITLPAWGKSSDAEYLSREYTIDIWDGNDFVFYTKTPPLREVTFPEGGVHTIRVTGIDFQYGICPGDGQKWQSIEYVAGKQPHFFGGRGTPIVTNLFFEGTNCQETR